MGVLDSSYVSTWVGFVYAAFVIDVFAKRIVDWETARSMATSLVLDAFSNRPCMPEGTVTA